MVVVANVTVTVVAEEVLDVERAIAQVLGRDRVVPIGRAMGARLATPFCVDWRSPARSCRYRTRRYRSVFPSVG